MTHSLETSVERLDTYRRDGRVIVPDVFLGGRLMLVQPEDGYRAGFDAVLLAAVVPVNVGRTMRVVDAGAGVGAVGLSLATRVGEVRVTLVEREPELAAMADWNVRRNGLSDRAHVVCADVTAPAASLTGAGLTAETYDVVVCNPPYLIAGASQSPRHPLKAASHQMGDGDLDRWIRFAARMLTSQGSLVMIHRTQALPELLLSVGRRFGDIAVVPIHSRAGEVAKRVLVKARKASRAPMRIMPGLVVHEGPENAFRPEVKAVSSDAAGLDLFRTVR